MEVQLTTKPNSPIIIEGFPGFGLVGTIATEFLIKHLNAKKIGIIWDESLPPIATIHDSKIIEPLGIFYAKKENIIILHALSSVSGMEWEIANNIIKLCKEVKCKELISIEGIGALQGTTLNTYYYGEDEKKKKRFESIGLDQIKEGLVIGVTAALLLKKKDISCIFVESKFGLADSKAAAKIIEVLDKYLGLKVDYNPLLKVAEEFENKLKNIIEKNKTIIEKQQKDKLDYMG